MTDKERKILEEAGLLYPVPNCVEYYQTIEEIAKEVADSIWEAINNKVQVVRCKDCVNYSSGYSGWHCYLDGRQTQENDFCSWGERREG